MNATRPYQGQNEAVKKADRVVLKYNHQVEKRKEIKINISIECFHMEFNSLFVIIIRENSCYSEADRKIFRIILK